MPSNKAIATWRGGKIIRIQAASTPIHSARNAFEAAQPSQYRKIREDRGSGNAVMQRAGDHLRVQARYLDENHDIATGILDILVNRTVGRGIRYEPQVLDKKGNLHTEFNAQLLDRHNRWSERPTVDGVYSRSDMERLHARTLFRDGDVFKIYYAGNIAGLQHAYAETPLSLEPLEPDFCPLHYNLPERNIQQGIRYNKWGRPTHYYFTPSHPGELNGTLNTPENYRVIESKWVNHAKFNKRFHQGRGQSIFHSVLGRLDDLKDYEEAERIAARIAAKLVGSITKGAPDDYRSDSDSERDQIEFENGLILYDMAQGERFELADNTNRPNSGLNDFRAGQLKAVSSGTMTSASSTSKNYDGTFSSQRQELVEQQESYLVLQDYLIEHSCKPDYRYFVNMTTLGGLKIPSNVDQRTLYDVACYGATMPWIDPIKEAKANIALLEAKLISRSELIRRRGGNPDVVYKQIERDIEREQQWLLMQKSK